MLNGNLRLAHDQNPELCKKLELRPIARVQSPRQLKDAGPGGGVGCVKTPRLRIGTYLYPRMSAPANTARTPIRCPRTGTGEHAGIQSSESKQCQFISKYS